MEPAEFGKTPAPVRNIIRLRLRYQKFIKTAPAPAPEIKKNGSDFEEEPSKDQEPIRAVQTRRRDQVSSMEVFGLESFG